MILEVVKLALELAKAGLELGKELVKIGKAVHADVSKARAARASKDCDANAAREYAEAKAKLSTVRATAPRLPARSGDDGATAVAAANEHEVLQGTMVLKTLGLTFSGTFVDGELEGTGAFESNTVRYDGDFLHGEYDGVGRILYKESGSSYTGQFAASVPHGTGKLVTKRGSEYSGRFENGVLVHGVIVTPKGIIFDGSVANMQPLEGTVTYTSGIVYTGRLQDWTWHGVGTLTYPKHNKETRKEYKAIVYHGDFVKCVFIFAPTAPAWVIVRVPALSWGGV
jgi:hypothetical protein